MDNGDVGVDVKVTGREGRDDCYRQSVFYIVLEAIPKIIRKVCDKFKSAM